MLRPVPCLAAGGEQLGSGLPARLLPGGCPIPCFVAALSENCVVMSVEKHMKC